MYQMRIIVNYNCLNKTVQCNKTANLKVFQEPWLPIMFISQVSISKNKQIINRTALNLSKIIKLIKLNKSFLAGESIQVYN